MREKGPEYNSEAEKSRELPHFRVGAGTVASRERPDRNEDRYLVDKENGVFGVFDGAGGHKRGDEASRIAVDEVKSFLADNEPQTAKDTGLLIERALLRAEEKINEALDGAATTAAVVVLMKTESGTQAVIGHVGDTRVYLISETQGNGHLTIDDSVHPEHQMALASAESIEGLSRDELEAFKTKNIITNSVGRGDKVGVHLNLVELNRGDKLLIHSDGVHDNLPDSEILAVLQKSADPTDPNESAKKLVAKAQQWSELESNFRAKPDDMTAVVIEIKE